MLDVSPPVSVFATKQPKYFRRSGYHGNFAIHPPFAPSPTTNASRGRESREIPHFPKKATLTNKLRLRSCGKGTVKFAPMNKRISRRLEV